MDHGLLEHVRDRGRPLRAPAAHAGAQAPGDRRGARRRPDARAASCGSTRRRSSTARASAACSSTAREKVVRMLPPLNIDGGRARSRRRHSRRRAGHRRRGGARMNVVALFARSRRVDVKSAPAGRWLGFSRRIALRTATAADADAIHALITDHLAEGHLLPRDAARRSRVARDRFVVPRAGQELVGCADLAPLSRTVAEVRSLVVGEAARAARGIGRRMVDELVARARDRRLRHAVRLHARPGIFRPARLLDRAARLAAGEDRQPTAARAPVPVVRSIRASC